MARSDLNSWIAERLVSFRESAGLDPKEISKRTGISLSGVVKMESAEKSNPTIENIDRYVKACGNKTLGEFFEPLIPGDNPAYDRYIHRVIRDSLKHPVARTHIRNFIGMLNDLMK